MSCSGEEEKMLWVWTSNGLSEIPEIAAMQSPCVRELLEDGITEFGSINLEDISLLQLKNVLEYCMHHYRNPDKDLKAWDCKFVHSHLSKLDDLFQAANYLGIDSLMDLCTKAHDAMIKYSKGLH